MNADGSKGVMPISQAGVKIDWLIWVGVGLAAIGVAIAGGCAFALRRSRRSAVA